MTADRDAERIAEILRREMARRRLSRAGLAHLAGVSLSTLEKALAGARPFTVATLVRLEDALDLSLRAPASGAAPAQAAADLGAYGREAVTWLEGEYVTLRPSFDNPGAVFAYRTRIYWDDALRALAFSEAARLDAAFSQSGLVAVPHQSGHVYLVTNSSGQHRLAILGRPTIEGRLLGLLSTLQAGPGSQLTPVSAPFVLIPIREQTPPALGQIDQGHEAHAGYRAHLAAVIEKGFARLTAV